MLNIRNMLLILADILYTRADTFIVFVKYQKYTAHFGRYTVHTGYSIHRVC